MFCSLDTTITITTCNQVFNYTTQPEELTYLVGPVLVCPELGIGPNCTTIYNTPAQAAKVTGSFCGQEQVAYTGADGYATLKFSGLCGCDVCRTVPTFIIDPPTNYSCFTDSFVVPSEWISQDYCGLQPLQVPTNLYGVHCDEVGEFLGWWGNGPIVLPVNTNKCCLDGCACCGYGVPKTLWYSDANGNCALTPANANTSGSYTTNCRPWNCTIQYICPSCVIGYNTDYNGNTVIIIGSGIINAYITVDYVYATNGLTGIPIPPCNWTVVKQVAGYQVPIWDAGHAIITGADTYPVAANIEDISTFRIVYEAILLQNQFACDPNPNIYITGTLQLYGGFGGLPPNLHDGCISKSFVVTGAVQ
jgi:hypothetical protein